MTAEEKQEIINAVLSSIRTNSKTITQLTPVTELAETDSFEISGGKRVTFGVLSSLIASMSDTDTDALLAAIALKRLKSVAITTTESTATLTISNAEDTIISCSVPIATDNKAGIITAAQKVKIDSAYTNSQTALTQSNEAKNAVANINNKLGQPNGIATLDGNGKLVSNQVPSNIPTLTDGKLSESVIPNGVATLDENGKLDSNQIPEDVACLDENGKLQESLLPSKAHDTLEFYSILDTATILPQSKAKYSTDEGVRIYYILSAKQFACSDDEGETFYSNWLDRDLYSDANFAPWSSKVYICTSTDTSYYWKSSVPALQPMGRDFTEEIQGIKDRVEAVEDRQEATLYYNGNVITGTQASNISLGQFVALTAGDAFAFIRRKGVVITLSTADGLKNYQWKGTTWNDTDDWRNFGGSAAVGNCYNVTNEASDLLPAGTGYFTLSTAIAAVETKGVQGVGMQITFAVGSNTWKTYQYVGADVSTSNFENEVNWVDMAGITAGNEAIINILDLCGPCTSAAYYNLQYAIAALQAKSAATGISYAKSGLIITYPIGENTWEAKQFVGSLIDFGEPTLWKNFGDGSSVEIETSDNPESGGEDAFSTGGAYSHLPVGAMQIETEETDYNAFVLVNADGDPLGDPFLIPKGGGGSSTSKAFSINFEHSPFYAAAGGSFVLKAAIRSAVTEGSIVTTDTIERVDIIDRDTAQTLYTNPSINRQSSDSSSDYSFSFDLSSFFTAATSRRLQLIAYDTSGDRATRTINVVAVDVTVVSAQTLNYTDASVVFTTDNVKSLPMYKFPNNQGTEGINAKVEIFINGEWHVLGTADIRDTYAHNITINPNDVAGVALTHGGYQIRIQGTDNASGVKGNTIYSTIMVVDPESTSPIVAMRFNDANNGTVRRYDSVELEVTAYTPGSFDTDVVVTENGTQIAALVIGRNTVQRVTKQVTGVTDGTVLAYEATSGSASSGTVSVTVSGSAIDAALTDGAAYNFDFSNRTNSEAGDHRIVSGQNDRYEITLKGANYSSNGFNNYLGANALAVKENLTGSLNDFPFSNNGIESSGFALLFKFATANVKNKTAHLMECYDETSGAGFYITGEHVGIYCKNGNHAVEERRYTAGEITTGGIVVEPGTKYVERQGTRYSLIKLFLNGEEAACIGYVPNGSNLIQPSNIKFNGTEGDFYLYHLIGWYQYIDWQQQFYNYLVKLTNTSVMVEEFNFEDVYEGNTVNGPSMARLAERGMPYLIESPFLGSNIEALDNTTSTSDEIYITLTYRNPERPWRNFIAYNVRRRNQGTTSAKRPIKNARYNLGRKSKNKSGSTYIVDGETYSTSVCLIKPELSREAFIAQYGTAHLAEYDEAVALFANNKVRVGENTIPVDVITVKVDYSDSTNANDCGACNMMNATYRALGGKYLTPAQRYYDGTYDVGSGETAVHLEGLQLNHSTANHPISMYRDVDGTGANTYFYAKGNWKEDKGEQVALGFKDTPGYNKGCLNYGDFVEYFGDKTDDTIAKVVARFLADESKDTSKVYLLSMYCGSSYRFYRYQNGAWTNTTGSMRQVNGRWVVTGDVLNPVDGYELLAYTGMDWFMGVTSVEDMMAPVSDSASWVQKLVAKGVVTGPFPAWTQYFECMVDDDQLQADLAMGRKVPYNLYAFLRFCNSCDYSKEELADTFKNVWRNNLRYFANPRPLFVYDGFTDYGTAVDQQAKNMQPMFFLDDGQSVVGGEYYNEWKTTTFEGYDPALIMYPNKIYDCDGLWGKDNDGGATVDPEVDPNKPSDPTTGYSNPYAGWGSVLWNNIHLQPEVLDDSGGTIDMPTVVAAMRSAQTTVDGKTLVPFSPEGAMHFFMDNITYKWQKTVSSYDGERKYINFTSTADAIYFYALHGLRLTAIPAFINTRFRFRDGYYKTGLFFTGVFSARINCAQGAGITIKAAKTGYFGLGIDSSGDLKESVYLEAGESHTFTGFNRTDGTSIEGALLYIYQSDRIAEINFNEISLSDVANFNAFTLAEKIEVGGIDHTTMSIGSYGALTNLSLGSLPFLKHLDVRNTVITQVNASQCPRLETLLAEGSQLSSVSLAETSPVSVLALPATISRLTLVNLPNLSYESGCLTFEGMSALTQIRIDGCPMLDGAKLLTDALAAGAAISRLRLAGIDVTGNSNTLVSLMSSGVTGIAADGTAYDESDQCSGLTGVWTCSDVIEANVLASLQAYFPLLTIYNAQYTVVEINERVASYIEPAIKNLDNGTTITSTYGYQPSGHISKIKSMLHVYKALYDSTNKKMQCWQVDDDDIRKLKNGDSFDRTDSDGTGGYDVMLGLPHFWYKGVNDHINQKKYLILSSEATAPRSSARTTRREELGDLLMGRLKAVIVANFNVGDTFSADNLSENIVANVYSMNVEGMKQVRWPALNSLTAGVLFLDADNKVISKLAISISDEFNDMQAGDYVFMSVPANAKTFIFTSPTGYDDVECIAVDSAEIEAIEPDWVEHDLCLVGTYKGYIDGYWRLRSLSGKSPINGTGTSTTWTGWANGGYDIDGNVIKQLSDLPANVPGGMNRTYLDLRNLSRCRGEGFQLVDYEMHKIVDILFIAFYGTKNCQALFGNGANGAATGGSDVYSDNLESDYSPLREASRPRFMGLEDWWGSRSEWMDYIALNVSSYAEFYKNRLTSVPSDSINDHYYRVRMPDGSERAILGDPSTSLVSGEIVRFRWGRYCDVIPSKIHSNSNYNQYWCDQQEGSNSTGRVVLRSGYFGSACYGFAYLNASNASSSSHSYFGSRLAFRGVIEIVE